MALRHADDTGMHFYDAELMRVRAHTLSTPDDRRAALAAALGLARHQDATLFEIRCLVDSFALLGEGDRPELHRLVSRLPEDGNWPEMVRAQRILA